VTGVQTCALPICEPAAEMYEIVSGRRPDLVAVTDLVATGQLLESFPGMKLPESQFAPSQLATDLLVWTYESFGDGAEQNEYLVEVIEDSFRSLLERQPSGSGLVGYVRTAVEEGRIAVWSADPAVQAGLSLTGADLGLGES